jgi:hypothetical protein
MVPQVLLHPSVIERFAVSAPGLCLFMSMIGSFCSRHTGVLPVIGRREGRRSIARAGALAACPVSARAAGQLASPPAGGKLALQRFTGWVPLPGLTKPDICREAGACP